jgi:uncharacterized protein YuzE
MGLNKIVLQLNYDEQADSAYVKLNSERVRPINTVACNSPQGEINLDFDSSGLLLGIEIIDCKILIPDIIKLKNDSS